MTACRSCWYRPAEPPVCIALVLSCWHNLSYIAYAVWHTLPCAWGKNDITPRCTAAGKTSIFCCSFFVKWVKSGHVTKPLFQLGGSPASHVGVFDFSSMTAPLQEEISADAPNCSWHGVGLPEYCLEMPGCLTRAVARRCQNKKKSGGTHTDKNLHTFTHLCTKTMVHVPTYTCRHTIVATHTTILVLCMCVCVSCRRMFVLVDSCQGCFGSSVWILCQTSLLSAAVESCGRARHCPRGLIWVSRHETGPKLRWQIQAPYWDPAALPNNPGGVYLGALR